MDILDAGSMGREFFSMALLLTAPVVVVSLVVGLVISIGQTVTSVQEQTLSFAPRIVAVVFLLIWLSDWYLQTLQTYTTDVFTQMVEMVK
ncbi:MAG: flagellar biosynthetic protein FliQ [Planctomycetota bacterium]